MFLFYMPLCFTGVRTKTYVRPNMRTMECLKTSTYVRHSKKFPCKDLGLCYRHYCGKTHLACPTCDFENDQTCRMEHEINSELMRNQIENRLKRADATRVFRKDMFVDDDSSPNHDEYRPQVVRIHAGDTWCIGFLATVNHVHAQHPMILTPAHCVVNFKVSCDLHNETTDTTEHFNNKEECFKRPKKKIMSVEKGFKSYTMTVARNGKSCK